MLKFLLKRLLVIVPTFVGVTMVAFFFIRLIPGDPVLLMAGERGVSPERYAQISHELGLDKPLYEQYGHYLWALLHGDFGTSLVTHQPVLNEFMALFPATLELSLCALLFALLIGIPAGVIAAKFRGKWLDQVIMTIALTGFSMPIFWWGLLLIVFFSGFLGVTPVSGRIDVAYWFEDGTGFMLLDSLKSGEAGAFKSAVLSLILPSIALGTIPMAVFARQTRSAMLEVLGEDYIKTAKAKGLSAYQITVKHALRNALIPVVTVVGLSVGVLLAGAILTETIFSWPGIGKWMVDSVFRRDYPVIQSGLVIIAMLVMAVNLLVDVAYGIIDPRIRQA